MVFPRFLAELKHRKIYRAAVVYAAVGWALLEAADVILTRLGFPDWTVDVVLAVVLLGFPLAIVFAWIFDIGAQGIVRTEPLSPAEHHHRFSIAAMVEFVLILALVVAVGSLYVDRLSLQQRLTEAESSVQWDADTAEPDRHPEQYRAIAVLPFADMSETGDQAWFAEGIAEELLIALSQVEPLSVKARTSSFAFKDTDNTIAEIADILGVQAVLEGSVRRSKDRVRVTAQLVDAHSGFHLWSGSYEREITDIFQLQDELAKSVVDALRIELRVDHSRPLVVEQTRIPEAYNWFIRGRAAYDWAKPQDTLRSISYFEKAVEADPSYALAWGYLSDARRTMMFFHPFDEAGPPTITAMEHALALDPNQSEALAVKAMMTALLDHDWEVAGRLYQRALNSSESQYATTSYALFYLQFIGQQSRAIELFADAEKLDPLHAGTKANLASIFYWSGDVDAAIAKAREALELDAEHLVAIQNLILAYTSKGNTAALTSLLESIPPAMQEMAGIKALVARSYALLGDADKAREIYGDLVASFDRLAPVAMAYTGLLAISLGDIDESIELWERIEKIGSWVQFWSKMLRTENSHVRENPRYQALLKRIGLDDVSIRALNERMSFN
jgi:TolB-like protein